MDARSADPLDGFLAALEQRHLQNLTFPEVRRALQALSSLYVERRGKIAGGAALDGAGKRAAFALFYGPLHFLAVREIVRALEGATTPAATLLDLGCGTGTASAAWAVECRAAGAAAPWPIGIDRSAWAVEEARFTWAFHGLAGEARTGDATRVPLDAAAILAAYSLNEMEPGGRERLLQRLLEAGRSHARVLVVEPLARAGLPWWEPWAERFTAAGGRAEEWRFRVELPELVARLDRAAGLDHRELGARSLWIGGER